MRKEYEVRNMHHETKDRFFDIETAIRDAKRRKDRSPSNDFTVVRVETEVVWKTADSYKI